VRLGGNGTGGIIYWHGFQEDDAERLYYAQIHTDTKLGAIIEENVGTADYHGQFRAFKAGTGGGGGISTNTDFTLEVDFVRDSIAAFVRQDDNNPADTLYYLLSGSYDDNGVISGDVTYDIFLNGSTNDRTPANAAQRVGKLTGLISKDNALGVFVSGDTLGTTSRTRGYVTGTKSRGLDGFVGGFVARRAPFTNVVEEDDNNNLVNYNDWNRIINPVDLASLTRSQFLQTNGRTISHGRKPTPSGIKTLDFATAEYDGTPALRGGDTRDGFTYFSDSKDHTLVGYSGIFSTTDLGGLLLQESDPTLTWNGQLNFRETRHDFTLNIEFSGGESGTINGFVEDILSNLGTSHDLLLEGEFDVSGVITGTTTFAIYTGNVPGGTVIGTPRPGILSGLIGQDGAVGVFNAINSSHSYAGGFVVHEDVVIKVDYDDWLRGATYATARTDGNKFLQPNGPAGQTFVHTTKGPVYYLNLNDNFEGVSLEGISTSGSGSFLAGTDLTRTSSNAGYAYAGILAGTDLGAPLRGVSDTFVRWLGLVQFNELTIESNFRVGFDNTGAGGTIWAINANLSDRFDLVIDGDFDANGVITGKTHYSRFIRDAAPARNAQSGTLRGIIGQEGAVGAFYGGISAFNYSGGFVARPTLLVTGDGVVKYNDWLRRTITDASPDTTNSGRSQFLRTNGTNISASGVTRRSFNRLSLARTRDDGLRLGGAASNGVIYFNTSGSNSYAGIYSGTNLGAHLGHRSSIPLKWNGVFGIAVGSANYIDDFTLTINTNATGGTISGTAHVSALNSDVTITGNFDERGVIFNGFANGRALSGLIGAEGAVGAFIGTNSAGGFVAHKDSPFVGSSVVRYSDWLRETNTVLVPASTGTQFLRLVTEQNIETGSFTPQGGIRRLDLADSRSDGRALRGASNNGLAYFTANGAAKGFSGIYSSTNLGLPVNFTGGNMTWHGILSIASNNNHYSLNDITFTIAPSGSGGIITGQALIGSARAVWPVNGTFDANGVIRGDVNNAVLRGIIGSQGAVAVFNSGDVSTAGGFVASPFTASSAPAQPRFGSVLPANADYTAWRDSFTSAPANLDTANRRNQLL
nr:hypothetical protein [Pseudomonadota bacterium]